MEKDIIHINQVLSGKTAIYSKLVDKHQTYVFSITLRILKNREEAEEAAQDVFIKAFRRLNSFNQKAKFTTWLYRIAYNTAIDYSRKKKRYTTSIDDDERFFNIEDISEVSVLEELDCFSVDEGYKPESERYKNQLTFSEKFYTTSFRFWAIKVKPQNRTVNPPKTSQRDNR